MLTMKKADYEKILAHAKENLPEEACGLIAGTKDGDKKIIEKVYLLENVDHTNEHFSMNPKEQLAAVKDMRTNHLVPLGNWHSHPESPSRPSEKNYGVPFRRKRPSLPVTGSKYRKIDRKCLTVPCKTSGSETS